MNGDATRKRIDHLEDLVKKLIAERQAPSAKPNSYSNHTVPAPESLGCDAVPPSPLDAGPREPDGAGETVIDGAHSVYHGGDEWYTVLREVRRVFLSPGLSSTLADLGRNQINDLKKTYNQQDTHDYNFRPTYSHTVDGSGLLYSQVKPIERIEILSTLPPKSEVDRLIAHFFNREVFPIAVARKCPALPRLLTRC